MPKIFKPSNGNQPSLDSRALYTTNSPQSNHEKKNEYTVLESNEAENVNKVENPAKCLLGLAYESSDDDDDDDE
ncbi:hypothetical protein PTKIN_Ptkin11bG0101500 [Pterospermum kingtungense]